MNTQDNPNRAYTLQRGDMLAVHAGKGSIVRIAGGRVWLTQYADLKDHILADGECFSLNGRGMALISAFERSRITLEGALRAETCGREQVDSPRAIPVGFAYACAGLLLALLATATWV